MSVFPATQVIDLRVSAGPLTRVHSEPVLNSGLLKAVRSELPQGEEIPLHSIAESATLHCLSGKVTVGLVQEEVELIENQMIFLDAHQPHVVKARTDAVLLMTMRNSDSPAGAATLAADAALSDSIDEASEESFPASDPPAFNSAK